MPGPIEVILLFLGQTLDTELLKQLVEGGEMQIIELFPGDISTAHPVHRGRVPAPPGVGEGRPICVEVLLLAQRLAFPNNGGAPVYDRAEHVEDECFRGYCHHILAPMRAASEAISS